MNAAPDDLGHRPSWSGGCDELSIHLGAPDDDRLERAARALWVAARLQADRCDDGDWLDLGVPLGALSEADRRVGGFPFGPREGCRPAPGGSRSTPGSPASAGPSTRPRRTTTR
ncbi:hypothetical protein [Nocardioides litoris]|uniref:hypothetical protein n=1 Tax=Nocardioides litoris TaxID=1926648 RepID=UPI0011222507|nr:hypothetical protein [Nocardioides litoris]